MPEQLFTRPPAWLDPADRALITADPALHRAFDGGCHTAVISPEGRYLAGPLPEGEGLAIATLDRRLIDKRKRMMDSVGHYSRPDLLGLRLNAEPAAQVSVRGLEAAPVPDATLEQLANAREAAVGMPDAAIAAGTLAAAPRVEVSHV